MSHKAAKVAEKMVRGRFKVFEFKGVLCVLCALARVMMVTYFGFVTSMSMLRSDISRIAPGLVFRGTRDISLGL